MRSRVATSAIALVFCLYACTSASPNPQASLMSVMSERAALSDKAETYHLSSKLYARLIESDPNNISYKIGYIRALRNTGDRASFLQYEKSKKLSTIHGSREYVTELIFTMLKFDLNLEAMQYLEQEQRYNSNQSLLFWLRGAVFLNQGKLDLAEKEYENCLAYEPKDEGCLFDYGQLLKKRENYNKLKGLQKN